MINVGWFRLWAVIVKEFIQMRRDKGTFAMIVAIPIMQVILFGFAINSDPKHLPLAVVTSDYSPFTRSLIQGMKNSDYFDVKKTIKTESEAAHALAIGEVQFILNIPANFSRDLVRGKKPSVLLEVDATDPAATGNAGAAMVNLSQTVLQYDLRGILDSLNPTGPPFDLRVHRKYNPDVITQYNIVPGLMGMVITMTMVMITSIAITRERERGTMENLLSTPASPTEIMIGKVIPYITVGYIQGALIFLIGYFCFSVPIFGSIILLAITIMPFIAANLSVGLLLSTVAKNQLQSVQMTIFFFLPSILLSGFMFPFRGMPEWAQIIGELLPLTHFLRIVRGILLKGNGWIEVWPDVWPILLFLIVVVLFGIKRFRRTLD